MSLNWTKNILITTISFELKVIKYAILLFLVFTLLNQQNNLENCEKIVKSTKLIQI